MLQLLIILAGILVGTSTGMELRGTLNATVTAGVTAYFPRLSVCAALIAGVALAQSAVIAMTGRWPQVALFISGPLPAIYGFVWFQNSLAIYRLAPQANAERGASSRGGAPTHTTLSTTITEVGLGAQMGLLLCAAGVRDMTALAVSILAAFTAATAEVPGSHQPALASHPWSDLLRCATGALLCALGVGTVIQRVTEGSLPGGQVTLLLVASFWTAIAIAFRRLFRSPNSASKSRGKA